MSERIELPDPFVERMRARLGPELPAFLAALSRPAEGLRVNTLRIASEDFREIAPFLVEPLAFPPEGFRIGRDLAAGRHPYHAAGLYYLQDPGAMAIGAIVDPRPGERVLDLAAAPGGKATHLAARMRGQGLLVANDPVRSRARELAGNLERCGVRNAIVTAADPERLARHFGPIFDRVLVDAPCSGESMFHKSAAARAEWSEAVVAGCARRQIGILDAAARLVAPGGKLFYSTCTFSTEENEEAMRAFLGEHADFEPVALPKPSGAEPVRLVDESDPSAAYFWPHRVPGAGHFVAAARRTGSSAGAVSTPEARLADAAGIELLRAFAEEVLPELDLAWDRIARIGDGLYELPDGMLDADGLGVVRSGLSLGTLRKGRFEPAHALALALRPADRARDLDLALEDDRVAAYLSGETVREPGESGWLVVRVGGFALGWGKRTGDIVKNHYPKGLRWHRR